MIEEKKEKISVINIMVKRLLNILSILSTINVTCRLRETITSFRGYYGRKNFV